jgi:hypothetical protein
MSSRKAILITGSHRSGSTWVGKIIAEAPSMIYLHEPFNPDFPPGAGICNAKFEYWFTHITSNNETDFYKSVKNTIELRYRLWSAFKSSKSIGDIKHSFLEYMRFFRHHLQGSTPVMKDPIALFSAEWLAEKFDMNVVVLIRHPAAFVSSIKTRNWSFDFSDFIEQPLLLKNYLYPFEDELRDYASKKHDLIDQGALLWKLMYYVVLQYQKSYKDWTFIRHEDLSRNPLQVFQELFSRLNLEFSKNVSDAIKYYSNSENPRDVKAPTGEISLRRNSELNISNWKYRLNSLEIERVRNQVEDISRAFYSDEDWV